MTRDPAPSTSADVGDRALALLAGTVAVLGGLVWATGELAGGLAAGRWPPVPLSAVPGTLVRLPLHLGNLRAAWPTPSAARLPGEAVMATVGLVLLAVVAGLLSLLRRLSGWSFGPLTRRRPQGARWATGRDLRSLRVPAGGEEGRVVLGRLGHNLIATEARHSVLVFGPTQSGKSTSLAIPALLEWPGPVLATSVKDDLVSVTRSWREQRGRCWVFDPTSASSSSTWSPIAASGTWHGAQQVANWLIEASPTKGGMSDGGFWFAAAGKLLAPLLLAAARSDRTMADVVRWTNTGDLDEAIGILDVAREAEAAVALSASASRDPRLRSSVTTTLETVLAPFEDPAVARATAGCDIDPAILLSGPHSLFLCGPSHEQARVQGLFAALVSSVVGAAVTRVHEQGHPLDPPLLLVLDEAANIAPLRDLDTLASTAAGLGIQLVTICQDLAQLAGRYGADVSKTIANNHRAKLALSGIADLSTLDLVSGLVGETAVSEETVTQDLRDGRRTRSSGVAFRRLAATDELRRIPPGHGVLVYGHLPAARLRLRAWYDEPGLRRRVP